MGLMHALLRGFETGNVILAMVSTTIGKYEAALAFTALAAYCRYARAA